MQSKYNTKENQQSLYKVLLYNNSLSKPKLRKTNHWNYTRNYYQDQEDLDKTDVKLSDQNPDEDDPLQWEKNFVGENITAWMSECQTLALSSAYMCPNVTLQTMHNKKLNIYNSKLY